MRLNGWQRIGIIASVAWFIGGGFWGNYLAIREGDWVYGLWDLCRSAGYDTDVCLRKLDGLHRSAIEGHWYAAAFMALAPLIIGWLAVYALVSLTRWIAAGFERHQE
jgi:hypothetical protein